MGIRKFKRRLRQRGSDGFKPRPPKVPIHDLPDTEKHIIRYYIQTVIEIDSPIIIDIFGLEKACKQTEELIDKGYTRLAQGKRFFRDGEEVIPYHFQLFNPVTGRYDDTKEIDPGYYQLWRRQQNINLKRER
ncbi:hypothetical protein ES703_12389 [subsurface metagenome]